jgi:predicted peptidase
MTVRLAALCVVALSVVLSASERSPALGQEPAAGKQVESSTSVKHSVEGQEHETTLRYWLYLPEGYKADGAEKWPLLLFLHGSGERGDNLEAVTKHGPPKLIAEGKQSPFIVVSPQCPKEQRWNAAALAKLVDHLANTHQVDRSRLYVTGLSMGGAGTWSLLTEYPNLFAAAVPICGRVDPAAAAKLTDKPIWIVVGAKDRAELVESNQQAAAELEKAGSKLVRLTVYPDAGHDSWTETYNNPEIYEWLLKHRRADAK